MECGIEKNKESCNCTYELCQRKGKCCECVRYHRERRELPACFFPDEIERTYDRSSECFKELPRPCWTTEVNAIFLI